MNFDNGCCCGCNTAEKELVKENKCPVCGNEGLSVIKITVEHLVAEDYRKAIEGDGYRIFMNENCNVVYYNICSEVKFSKDQVSVPIWFKKMQAPSMLAIVAKLRKSR